MLIGMIKWMHLSMEISFFKNDISIKTNMKSVSVPPVTSFSPAEASPTVLEGGSYNVTCLVSANPPAQVLLRYHHYAILISDLKVSSYHHPNGNSMSHALCHHRHIVLKLTHISHYCNNVIMSSSNELSCPANPPSVPKHRKCRHLA